MSLFDLTAVLITLAALLGLVSRRVLRLPATVGTMALALALSLLLLAAEGAVPALHNSALQLVARIDFSRVILHGMLSLLLFAGALHLDLDELRRQRLPVGLLAVLSTVLSTLLVALMLHALLPLVVSGRGADGSAAVGWPAALLFGALISPTDPVAVMEMLGRTQAPRSLRALLAGESLLNDGVGAVLFVSLAGGLQGGGSAPTLSGFLLLLAREAGGAVLLGTALGMLTRLLLGTTQDQRVQVLLTLALALGGYAIADHLNISAPLEAVVAGLVVHRRVRGAEHPTGTRASLGHFWSVVDDLMNAVLFLLLGLEILALPSLAQEWLAAGITVLLVLAARWTSVAGVVLPLQRWHAVPHGTLPVLTWGGLRGALSVALALSLPESLAERQLLLRLTYAVVIVSVLVQGLTVGGLLRRVYGRDELQAV